MSTMKKTVTSEYSEQNKAILIKKLCEYIDQELDITLGQFDAEFLFDFIHKEFAAPFYNQGLADAQTVLHEKLDAISDSIIELEKPII